jgi:hypothetical protein
MTRYRSSGAEGRPLSSECSDGPTESQKQGLLALATETATLGMGEDFSARIGCPKRSMQNDASGDDASRLASASQGRRHRLDIVVDLKITII